MWKSRFEPSPKSQLADQGSVNYRRGSHAKELRRGGVLILTRAAVEMLGEGVSRVQVGYNPKTGAVGLRGRSDDRKGGYLLPKQANSVSALPRSVLTP